MSEVLARLENVLQSRKSADPQTSYVATLYHRGRDAILKKVGEEATETIIAAKGQDRQEIVHETADLLFHVMVMLSHLDISLAEVLAELDRRHGRSGLEEKVARNAAQS